MSARLPFAFSYGNILLGRGRAERWALFAVDTHPYRCLSAAGKRERFLALLGAIEALEADFQLLRVSRALDCERHVRAGEQLLCARHRECGERYLESQARSLSALLPWRPEVFLAIRLVEGEQGVSGLLGAALGADRRGEQSAGRKRNPLEALRSALAPSVPRAAELEDLRRRADRLHARLAAYLSVRPTSALELQWLVRRAFCRALGEPLLEDLHEPRALAFECNGEAALIPLEADVVRWCEGIVEHRLQSLRIESELGVSHQAQLVLGALPERVSFPSHRAELLMRASESLPFGVDIALSARHLPNTLALRLARRGIQDADQILAAEAEGEQGASDRGYARSEQARELLSYLQSATRPPLLRVTIAIAVAARSPAELEERVEHCRRAFGEVRLFRPFGEQLALFLLHMPAGGRTLRGYEDVLTCEQVAGMMPTGAPRVGSRHGFHLGHCLSGGAEPVTFNLSEGSESDSNTAILCVGALGSGKTMLAQKLAYEAFLAGARIVDCDPKGDHALHLLEEVAPHCETVALRADPALRGLLDPLRIAPPDLRQEATVSFLRDLFPATLEPAAEAALVRAVGAVLRHCANPTCAEVLSALMGGDEAEAALAETLAVYAEGGLTQLAFARADQPPPAFGEKQVTYLRIRDLPAPDPRIARSERTQSERIGEQLLRLIAMLAGALMSAERSRLKVFTFDEGWRLLGDPAGRSLLMSLQRMGRSELAVPIISTQLLTDALLGERESLAGLLGATFVFGLRAEEEAERALHLLGLDAREPQLRRLLLEMSAGRCLLRDHRGRIEAVQIELVPRLLRSLATTPGARSTPSPER
ncbi:MAG TPA: ATP-binding protein [Solirubrobacteraceae bacterium]|nr:ATP-binding protein [Solirubrobacteraceae bacterium]